jgi:hypothetical protein
MGTLMDILILAVIVAFAFRGLISVIVDFVRKEVRFAREQRKRGNTYNPFG